MLAVNANVLTDYVKTNGMGSVDPTRLDSAIKQLAETYEYNGQPDVSLYFTDKYLPAGGFPLK
jgi:NitT/TauT family transport system substrate-binding protein